MMDCDTVDGEPEIRREVTTWDYLQNLHYFFARVPRCHESPDSSGFGEFLQTYSSILRCFFEVGFKIWAATTAGPLGLWGFVVERLGGWCFLLEISTLWLVLIADVVVFFLPLLLMTCGPLVFCWYFRTPAIRRWLESTVRFDPL